jgi:hypothetical protein
MRKFSIVVLVVVVTAGVARGQPTDDAPPCDVARRGGMVLIGSSLRTPYEPFDYLRDGCRFSALEIAGTRHDDVVAATPIALGRLGWRGASASKRAKLAAYWVKDVMAPVFEWDFGTPVIKSRSSGVTLRFTIDLTPMKKSFSWPSRRDIVVRIDRAGVATIDRGPIISDDPRHQRQSAP